MGYTELYPVEVAGVEGWRTVSKRAERRAQEAASEAAWTEHLHTLEANRDAAFKAWCKDGTLPEHWQDWTFPMITKEVQALRADLKGQPNVVALSPSDRSLLAEIADSLKTVADPYREDGEKQA